LPGGTFTKIKFPLLLVNTTLFVFSNVSINPECGLPVWLSTSLPEIFWPYVKIKLKHSNRNTKPDLDRLLI